MSEQNDPSKDGNGTGAVNTGNANSGVTAEMMAEIKKATSTLIRNMLPGLIKPALDAALEKTAEEVASAQSHENVSSEADGGASDKGRLNLKALETKLNELNQQLKQRDEALVQERQRVVDSQVRAEAREALAGILGADNPNIPFVMDSFYDTKKRFVQGQDGQVFVKFKSEYGSEDDLVPLKDGVKRLSEGELKHLLPSKTAALPANGRFRGSPVTAPGNGKPNPLDAALSQIVSSIVTAPDADPTRK